MTPLQRYKITAGVSHRLTLQKPDYFPLETTIALRARRDSAFSFILKSIARVSLRIEPADAEVIIDGQKKASLALANLALDPGLHKISLFRQGYYSQETPLRLSPGNNAVQKYRLEKIPAPPPNLGGVQITSTPANAAVWLDGRNAGTTPYVNSQLKTGAHQLRLSLEGYADDAQALNVRSGQTLSVTANLTAAAGGLEINSEPAGALIFVDGVFFGLTPARLPNIRTGMRRIVLRKEDFKEFTVEAPVAADRVTPVAGQLNGLGALAIASLPPGATILLDGQNIGVTPKTFNRQEAGSHRLTLRKENFADYDTTVTVEWQETVSILGKLKILTSTLKILVRPFGSIYIDDTLRIRDTDIQYTQKLPAGSHEVKVINELLGVRKPRVIIKPNSVQEIEIDLQKP